MSGYIQWILTYNTEQHDSWKWLRLLKILSIPVSKFIRKWEKYHNNWNKSNLLVACFKIVLDIYNFFFLQNQSKEIYFIIYWSIQILSLVVNSRLKEICQPLNVLCRSIWTDRLYLARGQVRSLNDMISSYALIIGYRGRIVHLRE